MTSRDAPARGFTDTFWLQWHLTDACNLACRHCYRAADASGGERSLEELEGVLGRYLDFLDAHGLAGRGRIQLAGGEPLLARSLLPLLERARDLGVPCRVLSNGTTATPTLARDLAAAQVRIVQVSLDGDVVHHDALRGEGAFDRALAGARALAESGIEVTVAATLCRENANQIIPIINAAVDSGASRVAFSRLVPQGAGADLRDELLSPEEWLKAQVTMLEAARRRGIALMPRDPTFTLLLSGPGRDGPVVVSGCAAGYNGLAVEPDGTVYPCRRLPIAVGNVFEDDLETLWSSPVLEALRQRDELRGACGRCDLRWRCGGCRGIAYALSGDMMGEDPQCPLRAGLAGRTWSWARRRWHRFRWENL